MKILRIVLIIVVIFLLIFDIFFLMIAHSSGHNIPLKTDLTILFSGLFLFFLLVYLFYIEYSGKK
jgi:uncharacterized membrane protein YjgN (DUF898 family)